VKANGFLRSALTLRGSFDSTEEILAWLRERGASNELRVDRIPLEELAQWSFEDSTGDLVHQSGKFFRVHGARVQASLGLTRDWDQPIIDQPEVGILGIVAREFDGVLHFLMQAKVEPGNIDGVQLTPTVQATRSNYTQVHQGVRPPYVDYFLYRSHSMVLVDRLQPEQGSAFLGKRNRNIIVQVDEDDLPVGDEHRWMTLGQVKSLLKVPNLVSMDARTVLSCIPLIDPRAPSLSIRGPGAPERERRDSLPATEFGRALLKSASESVPTAFNDEQVIGWLTDLKCRHQLCFERVGLDQVRGWQRGIDAIVRETGDFFEVVAVRVQAVNREVARWDQPLIKPVEQGLIAFIAKEIEGVLHFLVQGKIEPGNLDVMTVAPTVQSVLSADLLRDRSTWPPFAERVLEACAGEVRYSCVQSEEGGRFYHVANEYRVVQVPDAEDISVPENFLWVSLRQLSDLLRFGMVNVEARSLLACLPLAE
jgi:dTDP-4-dehydro-6-deoxy-alpha-D-glucopyranose 2,3-dehydratase